MLQFPRWIYRGTVDRKLVSNADEFQEHMMMGWRESVLPPEKYSNAGMPGGFGDLSKYANKMPVATQPSETPDDSMAPTRAELEEKARELGIRFLAKTTDEKLGEMIQLRMDYLERRNR